MGGHACYRDAMPGAERPSVSPPLAVRRLRAGLSARELARRAGISPSVVLHAERGGTLEPRSQKAIADALGVDDVLDLWPLESQRLHPDVRRAALKD